MWHQRPTLLPLGRPAQGVQGSVAPEAGAQDLGLAWAVEPVRRGSAQLALSMGGAVSRVGGHRGQDGEATHAPSGKIQKSGERKPF